MGRSYREKRSHHWTHDLVFNEYSRDNVATVGRGRERCLLPFGEGVDEFCEEARLLRKVGEFRH